MRTTPKIAALLAGAALSLAACSTTDDADTASASDTSTQTTASAETMPAPADDMASPPADPAAAPAATNPIVGGSEMFPTKDIVDNAVNSKDHTTLVAAVQAAGLVETLKGPGPFTVFAPTNEAFSRLPAGTVDTLLKPENKATLTKVLTYHVVAGRVSAADLTAQINAGGGTARLTTVEGSVLTATLENGAVKLTDANGNVSYVSQADVFQSNGVIHVVNGVVLPKLS